MKKKHKIFFGILVLIFGIVTISNTKIITDVFGKDNNENKDLEEEVKPLQKGICLQGGANAVRAESKYHPQVLLPSHFPTDRYFIVKVDSGVFDVYVYELINGVSHKEEPIKHFTTGIGYARFSRVDFQLYAEPKDYAVVFVLKESDDLCGVGEGTLPKQNSDGTWTTTNDTGYVYYYYVGLPSFSSNPKITNVNYNGICQAFRNGNYDSYVDIFKSVGLEKNDFLTYRGSINFPYCYNQTVEYNYSMKEAAEVIRNKIAAVKIVNTFTEQSGTISPPPEDAIVVEGDTDLSSDDNAIQCSAYQNSNGIQIPNRSYETKKYYKTETKNKQLKLYSSTGYNSNGDGTDGVCSQTCQETVTVTYGPPVASKAGLCFEYKVKVESKLDCHTDFTAKVPQPEDYNICTPTGSCNGGAYHSASGPNEEFDSCVTACDGGNYTQSCINKCYKEVYGTASLPILPLSYNNVVMAKQMKYNEKNINELSPELREYYNKIISSGPDAVGPGKTYSIDELQIALTEAGTGYYYVRNGSILWNSGDGRYWELPGRYYTLNIPQYTISRLQYAGPRYCNNKFTINNKKQCGVSLIDTGIGLLRNNSGTAYCGAVCTWYGCPYAKANDYYKGKKATSRQFLNSADAIDVYKQEFEIYENAAKECKAKATCSTETAEFTIKVNNKTKDNPDVDNWIDYKTSIINGNLAGTTVNGSSLSNSSIVLDRSGCYGEIAPDGNSYMTEWSFPGTWVNNKTGKISYDPKGDSAWHLKKEKFCTNLNSKYVNTEWWNQRILHSNDNVPDSLKATIEEYNIIATAKNFGYFAWDFKVKCFYALYDNPIPTDSGGNDSDNTPLSHDSRTVSLTDIFPDGENETATVDPNATGRTPGYNWTDAASNMKNLEYEVTPGALYSVIQARGNEIYDANKEDTYLDYEFYLSPSDLSTIRKYSKSDANGKYSNYPGVIKVANGVAYYESALFRNSSTNSHKLNPKSVITLGALGVNNQKMKGSNEAETFENVYTATLKQNREDYLKSLLGGNH